MNILYKFFKKYHKWLGVSLSLFLLFFALSGIILNHRATFSKVDVKRSWLPSEYRYSNWNNAAIRGAKPFGTDTLMVYGNSGAWKMDAEGKTFVDFNQGFPKGIDNRKIADIHITQSGEAFAATLFGLYRLEGNSWTKVDLPIDEMRIVALEERGDTLIVMGRSDVLLGLAVDNYTNFSVQTIQPPVGAEKRVSLFKTIWFIHSGKILGTPGKFIVDLGGVAMILLSLTGLVYFFAPSVLKRIRSNTQIKSRIKAVNRWSYKWHLHVGIISAILLLIVTFTGMFLRPPLLIPIASKSVKPIKGSKLDSPNYWNDNLRDIHYDTIRHIFLLATADGIYALSPDLREPPVKFALQPPVSVMGINVLWQEDFHYVVGSFSGLFKWNPFAGVLADYVTNERVEPHSALRSPFGALAIAGGIEVGDKGALFFDYNTGVFMPNGQQDMFPTMPQEIVEKSGMSLWNLALEVHTWRIIKFATGGFYILVVPLAGIFGLVIVISGLAMWVIRYRNRTNRKQNENS